MPTSKTFMQCIYTITFKSVIKNGPCYLKEIFEFALYCRIDVRNKSAKLKIRFCKTNLGQKAFSIVAHIFAVIGNSRLFLPSLFSY